VVAARRAGLPEAAVAALAGPGPAEGGLTEAQRALARFCDQVVARSGAVDDGVLAEMRAHFEEHEIVELTVLAGLITMLNYVAALARLPLDPRTAAAP
jgi:alkylhydroperoxidase family enzyme